MNTAKRAPVVGFSELYEVDSDGNVWRIKAGQGTRPYNKPLSATKHSGGYRTVTLTKDGNCYKKYIHRLVAEAFLQKSDTQTEVNHKNGVKHDNRLENLEWVSRLENNYHAKRTGLNTCNTRKLTDSQIQEIKDAVALASICISKMARRFGVNSETVRNVVQNKSFRWKNEG